MSKKKYTEKQLEKALRKLWKIKIDYEEAYDTIRNTKLSRKYYERMKNKSLEVILEMLSDEMD